MNKIENVSVIFISLNKIAYLFSFEIVLTFFNLSKRLIIITSIKYIVFFHLQDKLLSF